jgi:hypothetical protein
LHVIQLFLYFEQRTFYAGFLSSVHSDDMLNQRLYCSSILTLLGSGHENLHETYWCRMYSRKLLMMGREDARNMWSFITESNWDNYLSHLVGYKKKTVMMHGNMNVKFMTNTSFVHKVLRLSL